MALVVVLPGLVAATMITNWWLFASTDAGMALDNSNNSKFSVPANMKYCELSVMNYHNQNIIIIQVTKAVNAFCTKYCN